MNEVETRTQFANTPQDGNWYQLPNEQYIRWNSKLNMWDQMVIRDGKAITSGQVPLGTELFGVEQ